MEAAKYFKEGKAKKTETEQEEFERKGEGKRGEILAESE